MEAWKWSAAAAGATIAAAVAWSATRPPACLLPAATATAAPPAAVPAAPAAAVATPAPPVIPAAVNPQPAGPDLGWDDCPACGMG